MSVIKIAIIEDQPMVMENLSIFFNQIPIYELVLSANSVEAFLEKMDAFTAIDILILDIGLPRYFWH